MVLYYIILYTFGSFFPSVRRRREVMYSTSFCQSTGLRYRSHSVSVRLQNVFPRTNTAKTSACTSSALVDGGIRYTQQHQH